MKDGVESMATNAGTPYETQADILAELWLNYRDEDELQAFMQANDIAMPLSYMISNGIVETTPLARKFISEAFQMLLDGLEIKEDTGFEIIEDVFDAANTAN